MTPSWVNILSDVLNQLKFFRGLTLFASADSKDDKLVFTCNCKGSRTCMITSELFSSRARRVNEFLSSPRTDWTSIQPTTPSGTTGTGWHFRLSWPHRSIWDQCFRASFISCESSFSFFGSNANPDTGIQVAGVAEPKIFLSAPTPRSRKSEFRLRLRLQLRPRLQIGGGATLNTVNICTNQNETLM